MATGPEPAQAPAKPRRKGIRLWVVMAILPVVAVPLAWQINRARAQKRAVEAIGEAGGRVVYDYEFVKNDPIASDFERGPAGKPRAPDWLAKAVGPEPFQTVATVAFRTGQPIPLDGLIGPLSGLDRVGVLEIAPCDDRDLARLAELGRVEGFNLTSWKAPITDAGLGVLRKATQLRYLQINDSRITDAGLAHVEGLTGLEYLHLSKSAVTDAGLVHLRPLKRLRSLVLDETAVGDAGMEAIGTLPGLETLMIRQTKVGDEGLSRLAGLGRLNYLDLGNTNVTDVGLSHLKSLKSLKYLQIGGKKRVTPAGLAALKAALPGLNVVN